MSRSINPAAPTAPVQSAAAIDSTLLGRKHNKLFETQLQRISWASRLTRIDSEEAVFWSHFLDSCDPTVSTEFTSAHRQEDRTQIHTARQITLKWAMKTQNEGLWGRHTFMCWVRENRKCPGHRSVSLMTDRHMSYPPSGQQSSLEMWPRTTDGRPDDWMDEGQLDRTGSVHTTATACKPKFSHLISRLICSTFTTNSPTGNVLNFELRLRLGLCFIDPFGKEIECPVAYT